MQAGEIKESHQEFQLITAFNQLDEPCSECFACLIGYEICRHAFLPALLTKLGRKSRR